MSQPSHPIQLDVISLNTALGPCQTLTIEFLNPEKHITPQDMAQVQLPQTLDLTREVILFGPAPIWLYGRLKTLCQDAPWIACYDMRLSGAVVIHSQGENPRVGDVVQPILDNPSCPAILIGGPPESGKSVLSNALRQHLIRSQPHRRLFLHRASWDGEGNWTYEATNRTLVGQLVRLNEYRIHESLETKALIPNYFDYHAQAVRNMRSLTDTLLVDVGGRPQKEKYPLLEQCTHYIIISRFSEAIGNWHQFCQPYLKPIAVIHSVLEPKVEIISEYPFLEIIAGPWLQEETTTIPPCLMEAITAVLR